MAHPVWSLPPKPCAFCGTGFSRRRLETRKAFLQRRFCSLSCANSKAGRLTKHGYSWRARKHLKRKCEACGSTMRLIAHHVDQDKSNNTPGNIQTLCKWCHDFWHATQKRLGLSSAGRMPALNLDGSQATQESPAAYPVGWTDLEVLETQLSRKSPFSSEELSSKRR